MKLLTDSGGKLQSVEDGIGSGSFRIPADPFLHARQPCGGLMDVVALSDVDNRFEQLFDALFAFAERPAHGHATRAPRRARYWPHFTDPLHPIVFPVITRPR